jgi:agmatine/peptidylarginine deiminase
MNARTKIVVTLFFTLLTISLGLFLLTVEARGEPMPEEILPKYMTPAESLRVDEIGKFHKTTPPPSGWVETPGEFEHLRGVWISWLMYSYSSVFCEIVRETVDECKVYIIVGGNTNQNYVEDYLQNHGVSLDSVYFYHYDRNSVWIRDYGPWFIREEGDTEGIVDFIYNRPRPDDDAIPDSIGSDWGLPVYGSPLEHPGGNFMTDGLGTGFASDLIYDENPGYSAAEIDSMMLAYSGLDQFVVVQKINIEYTGHIDLWTKCLNDTLIMVGEYEPGHPNHDLLNQHAEYFKNLTNREGRPYRVVRIPMPDSEEDAPPTYLNSLIVNDKVLVPLWGEAEDDTALVIYQNAMPDHEIVGIDCSSMANSGGAIHCITMQAPAAEFVHIKHAALEDTEELVDPYRVRAQILTSSAFTADSTLVRYRAGGGGSFSAVSLSAVIDTPGVYEGFIPAQAPGDTVHYYLQCLNTDGVRRTSPWHAPSHLYSFLVGSSAPVPVADLKIDLSGDDLALSWSPVTIDGYGNPITVDHYYIYRDTVGFFGPGSVPFDSTAATSYLDGSGVTGDIGTNYYYAVTAVSGTKESILSGICGEFDRAVENGE